MNKRQLIAAASRRSSLTQGQTREALEAILEVIAGAPPRAIVLPTTLVVRDSA